MRNIYSDEAGTSAPETVSIVVALIVQPDAQWHPVAAEIRRLIREKVPSEHAENFVFHATTLARERNFSGWEMGERWALIKEVMSLPRRFSVPITYAAVRRGSASTHLPVGDLRPFEMDHLYAFSIAMCWADKHVRQYYGQEVAQIISEDHQIQRALDSQLDSLRSNPLNLPIQFQRPNTNEVITRIEENKIERIIDRVHFMKKHGSPFLQIADACAFGIRRFFAHRDDYGRKYVQSIFGEEFFERQVALQKEDWQHFEGTRDFSMPLI